ncbi:unnamed protein product [Caenorhabditis sp. 36 PRJEB53466]|nr:unnamed protein product [Caenorhabditis sp. 36 PRJEB53466]
MLLTLSLLMLYTDWSSYQRFTQHITAVCSILINAFLIILILTKSPSELGAYKYLMIIISIYEITYSLVDVIVEPVWYSVGSVCVVLAVTKGKLINASVIEAMNSAYAGCFGFSLAIFALHFIYRYMVMSGNRLLKSFDSWKFFLWLSGPIFVGTFCSIVAGVICGRNEAKDERIRAPIFEAFGLKTDEFTYFGTFLYWESEMSPNGLAGVTTYSFFIVLSMITVAVFSVKCYFKISVLMSHAPSSAHFKSVQSQLFYALVAQTLIPIVLIYIPSTILFTKMFLDENLGQISDLVSITIAIYPAIDPFPTLFMIKNYRRAILGCVSGAWRRVKETSSAPSRNRVELDAH